MSLSIISALYTTLGSCFSVDSRFFPAVTVVFRGRCLACFEDFSVVPRPVNYGL